MTGLYESEYEIITSAERIKKKKNMQAQKKSSSLDEKRKILVRTMQRRWCVVKFYDLLLFGQNSRSGRTEQRNKYASFAHIASMTIMRIDDILLQNLTNQ